MRPVPTRLPNCRTEFEATVHRSQKEGNTLYLVANQNKLTHSQNMCFGNNGSLRKAVNTCSSRLAERWINLSTSCSCWIVQTSKGSFKNNDRLDIPVTRFRSYTMIRPWLLASIGSSGKHLRDEFPPEILSCSVCIFLKPTTREDQRKLETLVNVKLI